MASWLNSCLKLPIAAPRGACVLSRRKSLSILGRLASVRVLASAIRNVVRVLAWLFRLASWPMRVGLGGAVSGVTRSILLVVDERVLAVWRQCDAVVPYELDGEWMRDGTSVAVEARFCDGRRGVRVSEVG